MTGTGSGGRNTALLILNLGVRSGWVVNITPQHVYQREGAPVPIIQEAKCHSESV
jgi:hypothetical protein